MEEPFGEITEPRFEQRSGWETVPIWLCLLVLVAAAVFAMLTFGGGRPEDPLPCPSTTVAQAHVCLPPRGG